MELRPHCHCHTWSSGPWPTAQGLAPPLLSLSLSFQIARIGDAFFFFIPWKCFPRTRWCDTEPPWGFLPLWRLLVSPPVPPFFFHFSKWWSTGSLLCSALLYCQCLFLFLSPKKGIRETCLSFVSFQFYRLSIAKLALILSISVIHTRVLVCAKFCRKLFLTHQIVCSYLLDDRRMRFASKSSPLLMCQGWHIKPLLYICEGWDSHDNLFGPYAVYNWFFCVFYDLVKANQCYWYICILRISVCRSWFPHAISICIPWRGSLTHAGARQSQLCLVCAGWILLPLRKSGKPPP